MGKIKGKNGSNTKSSKMNSERNNKMNFDLDDLIHPKNFVRFFEKSLLSRFKYPKILLFVLVVLMAYFCFQNNWFAGIIFGFGEWGYFGALIFGLMFSFGFTTPFAIGFFISFNPQNIFLAALAGGFGAMLGDLLIFKLVKFSFQDEFELLKRENLFKDFSRLIHHTVGKKITVYVSLALAGFLIASPLPDEAGVTIIAGITNIKKRSLAIISFLFNTLGIYLMLLI